MPSRFALVLTLASGLQITCFQFVPSLKARHGTLPVPPVLR